MHSAVVAALGTLKGPLHGGANEQVMRGLEATRQAAEAEGEDPVEAVGTPDRRPPAGRREDHGIRAPGVQGGGSPGRIPAADGRPTSPQPPATRPTTGCPAGWRRSSSPRRASNPNVDFFAATVYHYLGIPTDLFTPVFLGEPDGRLDGAHHGAARRQQADPAGQRVHRRERADPGSRWDVRGGTPRRQNRGCAGLGGVRPAHPGDVAVASSRFPTQS